jgi:cation transport ATPase
MENSLAKVDELIHISESMRKIAMQSAVGGMLFSFAGMGFAAAGLISPVMAALLQEIIDVVAILNALRLTWKKSVGADIRQC